MPRMWSSSQTADAHGGTVPRSRVEVTPQHMSAVCSERRFPSEVLVLLPRFHYGVTPPTLAHTMRPAWPLSEAADWASLAGPCDEPSKGHGDHTIPNPISAQTQTALNPL